MGFTDDRYGNGVGRRDIQHRDRKDHGLYLASYRPKSEADQGYVSRCGFGLRDTRCSSRPHHFYTENYLSMLQKLFLNRERTDDISIRDILFISCAFSCMLLVGRAVFTGLVTYGFLLWNLFLAVVPCLITQWISRRPRIYRDKLKLSLAIMAWLLFVPNSFYIITDLFHLDKFDSAPEWFDLLLIFSFAWNGLLLGVLSIRSIEKIVERVWGRSFSVILLFVVMWLNALGIYLGRYLRFNSWDIFTQPQSLLNEMTAMVLQPLQHKAEWGMISAYAAFMLIIYITLKKVSASFRTSNR